MTQERGERRPSPLRLTTPSRPGRDPASATPALGVQALTPAPDAHPPRRRGRGRCPLPHRLGRDRAGGRAAESAEEARPGRRPLVDQTRGDCTRPRAVAAYRRRSFGGAHSTPVRRPSAAGPSHVGSDAPARTTWSRPSLRAHSSGRAASDRSRRERPRGLVLGPLPQVLRPALGQAKASQPPVPRRAQTKDLRIRAP